MERRSRIEKDDGSFVRIGMQSKSGGYGNVLMLSKKEGRMLPVFRNRTRHNEEQEND